MSKNWREQVKMRLKKLSPLFYLFVVAPTLISILYFGIIASRVYVSESTFVVRSANSQSTMSAMGSLLSSVGVGKSVDDAYNVQTFISSRAALQELEQDLPVKAYYSHRGDWFSRFNPLGFNGSNEAFYQYFREQVSMNIDSVSGIATLRVKAFVAEHGYEINRKLIALAENRINELNNRAHGDAIKFAQENVNRARDYSIKTAQELMEFRIKNGLFDVNSQTQALLQVIESLQAQVVTIQTQIAQLKASAPQSPQIRTLEIKQKSLEAEIAEQMKKVVGDNESLVGQSVEYQRLNLENTMALQQLTSAITSLQAAQDEASRKQLYLEVISPASKPDLAELPNRLYNIFATFIIGLLLYGLISLILASVREHKN
ncbi:capsule biosynthesis protein [Psittacicella gerlachiana]|uniref:Capsule biosynthesis protein n=1 Tax=Psittacicella gerlachiana TaxID=2028574 RepID=A0A3A1YJP8_9GAMM|nr:capsule biosynthesis protein [Psittacicella gerlachiana]RIY38493.1 capsule biosynthesis protein [Psittacicella gerlachiana]